MMLSRLIKRGRRAIAIWQWRPRRVNSWLMLLVTATLLPPVIFGGGLILFHGRTDYDDAIGETQADSHALASVLDKELSSTLSVLDTLGASRTLRAGDLAAFYDEAVAVARQHPEGFAIALTDAAGNLLLHTGRPYAAPLALRSDQHYAEEALHTGRPVISDLFVSAIIGQPVVVAYVPVLREGGPSFVLSARLTLGNIVDILRQQPLAEEAVAWIMDGRGTIVARSLRNEEVAGRPADPALVAAARRAPQGHVELTSQEGVPIVAVWTRSPLTGWTASVSIPRAQLAAPLVSGMVALAIAGLLALMAGLLAAGLLARRIQRPLARLASDAALLDQGAEPGKPSTGINEIDGVGAALAAAAHRLRGRDAERDAFESRQRLLMAELDHRVKNTLAAIQAIARQSLPAGEPRDAFIGRVQALAAAHAILGEAQWQGASIARLVRAAVEAYADEADRLSLEGPELMLKPKAAQSINLVLHELATNAAKYGSLSTAAGRLEVAWQVREGEGRRLALAWRESGGPPVGPPSRQGFGSRLITHAVMHDLDGAAELRYPPEGLACDIEFPLAGLERVEPASPRGKPAAEADDGRATGRRILVAEDSAWLATELSSMLADAGFRVIGPAATLARALELAGREPLDGAVLDVNLDGQPVFPAAELLRRRAIPFVFLSGYGESYPWPPQFAGVPRLSKPLQPGPLLAALASAGT
jgi:two-component sensor histidine kinase